MQRFLGYAEIAELAGIAQATVRSYKRYGYLPPADAMIGDLPGWKEATIRRWIAARPGAGKPWESGVIARRRTR